MVAASGNDGLPQTSFDAPAGSGIVVVGAADENDRCAPFTNYGAGLDILAPGVDILSTFSNQTPDLPVYAYADGSSLAVPFVAGAAALLMSTGLTNVEAVERILATARGPATSCRGEATSYRHLDVASALGASGPEPAPSPASKPTQSSKGPFTSQGLLLLSAVLALVVTIVGVAFRLTTRATSDEPTDSPS